jgi:predicted Rossmann fold flavoprotein
MQMMRTALRQFDVIVLGAGAAGLMCAAEAARRGRRVALIDHNGQPGRKILASGGGRCNFTNLHCGAANYLSENKHFSKSALALYQPRNFVELVDRHGIGWHEKAKGQLFCDGSSRAIVEMLVAECEREPGRVEMILDARVSDVEGTASGKGGYRVATTKGDFAADALMVATGGLSFPRLGASALGYEVARHFGLGVVEPRPALVPLLLGGGEAGWRELAGVATEVEARAGGKSFTEQMLVTHRGLSGPAILQASSYWRRGEALTVDFAPRLAAGEKLLDALIEPRVRRDIAALKQALRAVLPHRLANYLAESGGPKGWSNAALEACEKKLRCWEFHPTGSEGFSKAEVTAGGVDTDELHARTMEVKSVTGLFFAGEVIDVTGELGGFNLQWAWSSGVVAGRAV